MKEHFSEEKIVKGFKENDEAIIKNVYSNCFKFISWFVQNDGGSFDDAKDVLQDAMMIFFRKCKKRYFVIETHPETYIINICKLLWLEKKRKNKYLIRNYPVENLDEKLQLISDFDENSTEKEKSEELRKKIYKECFKELKDECKKLLTLAINGESNIAIKKALEYKDEAVIIERKRRCKQKLLELISIHPKYKELNNE